MGTSPPEKPVIIIGAGVVGLTLAHGLANVRDTAPTHGKLRTPG
jgi:cation diffusion facilitator CzcD-associated flavoprotein CzcO